MVKGKPGFFLVLEGLPGSGKTTIGRMLMSQGWTYFPEIATVLGKDKIPIGDRGTTLTDFMIFNEEIRRITEIEKLISNGKDVVVDGYFPTDLSFAYARYKRRQSTCYPTLLSYYINALAQGSILKPDLYIFMEIPPAISVERQLTRNDEILTTLSLDILQNVTRHLDYIHNIFESDVPVIRVNATKLQGELTQEILSAIQKRKTQDLIKHPL
jgi:thymidylate kinase